MTEPIRGYIESHHCNSSKSTWEDYTAYCNVYTVPRILVAKATYWKVEVDARTMTDARFTGELYQWIVRRAHHWFDRAESQHRYPITSAARIVVYGLSLDDARSFAGDVIERFPIMKQFPPIPGPMARGILGPSQGQPVQERQQKRPPNLKGHAYRLNDGNPVNVVSLAMKRKERYPDDTDASGLPKPRNPWKDGPA